MFFYFCIVTKRTPEPEKVTEFVLTESAKYVVPATVPKLKTSGKVIAWPSIVATTAPEAIKSSLFQLENVIGKAVILCCVGWFAA